MLVKKRFGGDDEAWRAEAALLRVIVDESLLYGMEMTRLAKPFHGRDLRALGVDGEHRAGVHGFVVHQHGASAAGAAVTDSLGASELKLVAQGVQQGDARLKLRANLLAVHVERYRNFARPLDMRSVIKRERPDLAHERHGRRDAGDFQEVASGDTRAGR